MQNLCKLVLFCLSFCVSAQAAITISSNNSGGGGRQILTSTGVLLTGGSVRIGYFSNIGASDSVMRGSDWGALNALFIALGEAASPTRGDVTSPASVTGTDLPIPVPSGATAGRYSGSIGGITQAGAPEGIRLFLLISNSSDPVNSPPTEWALVSEALWTSPFDDPGTGGTTALALNATNINDAAADVWRGSLSTTGASANFLSLAAVPEPGTLTLCLVAVGMLARRRRK